MVEIEDLCDAEWADGYRLTPQERWCDPVYWDPCAGNWNSCGIFGESRECEC